MIAPMNLFKRSSGFLMAVTFAFVPPRLGRVNRGRAGDASSPRSLAESERGHLRAETEKTDAAFMCPNSAANVSVSFAKALRPTGLHQFRLLDLASCRRQFELENRASVCPGGYPNPTGMVFDD